MFWSNTHLYLKPPTVMQLLSNGCYSSYYVKYKGYNIAFTEGKVIYTVVKIVRTALPCCMLKTLKCMIKTYILHLCIQLGMMSCCISELCRVMTIFLKL
jgi:hypothetical protein